MITDFDPEIGQKVHKLRLKTPLPMAFLRRKATESLTNARHAFDQATFAARNLVSGHSNKSIYFPWASNPIDLKRLLENRGIDPRLWDIFEFYEPYPTGDGYTGGSDAIRAMATMANSKHTVGLVVSPMVAFMRYPVQSGIVMRFFYPPQWDQAKDEAIIATWKEDAEPQGEYDLKFQILFDYAQFPHSINVPLALDYFAQAAEMVIERLERRCHELEL